MARAKRVSITLDGMLAKMRRGREYTAAQLASQTGWPVSTIRHLLATDRAWTRLDQRSAKGGRVFSLAGTCATFERPADTRIGPDLTSTIRGYEAALMQHRLLAEAARR